jgi:MarR family transcriptional regulator, transcriptional regulator for hemolysin
MRRVGVLSERESANDRRIENRMKRERILAAALDLFPPEPLDGSYRTWPVEPYGGPEHYPRELAVGPIEALRPMLTQGLTFIIRRWRTLLDDLLRKHGQSLTRWHTLYHLSVHGPGETLTSISNRVGVKGPTLNVLLDDLERDGLIERVVDKNDRRSKFIILTPEGKRVGAALFEVTKGLRDELLKGVGKSEILLMLDAIDIMKDNLENLPNQK